MATANFGVEHRKWQPVKFEMRLNSVGGLLARQSEPVISSLHGPSNTHFIKLVKTQGWLQRLVTGTKCNHALNETTLLEDLIQKVINGDCSVVAGIPDATDDDALIASLDYDTPVAFLDYTVASGYGNTVSGVASANISKVCGVATASIENVMGV